MENSMEVPRKIKNGTTVWSSNSTVGTYQRERNQHLEEHVHPAFNAASFTAVKTWEQPEVLQRMDGQRDVGCICTGWLCSHKRKDILPFATTWMSLEDMRLSETARQKTQFHRNREEQSCGCQGLGEREIGVIVRGGGSFWSGTSVLKLWVGCTTLNILKFTYCTL